MNVSNTKESPSILRKIVKLLGFLCLTFSVFMIGMSVAGSVKTGVDFIDKFLVAVGNLIVKTPLLVNGFFLLLLLFGGIVFLVWGLGRMTGGEVVKNIIITILLVAVLGFLMYALWNQDLEHLKMMDFITLQYTAKESVAQVFKIENALVSILVKYGILFGLALLVLILIWTEMKGKGPKLATIWIRILGFIPLLLLMIAMTVFHILFELSGNIDAEWITDLVTKVQDVVGKVLSWVVLGTTATLTVGNIFGVLFFWRG
jgi:hypothetical protein